MEIKIYREKENESLIISDEELKEYNALAFELGLQTKEKTEENDCPIVYPVLNDAMQRQLRALCPSSVLFKSYTRSTIPLEILKVVKFIEDNKMFDDLKVWFDEKEIDPIIIGYKWQNEEAKLKGYTWKKDKYLIARWGDCAKEIPELLEDGFNRIKKELEEKAIVAQEKCSSILNNLDVYTRKIVTGNASDMNIDLRTDGDNSF